MSPRDRALTAINEAISCLDRDTTPGLPTDGFVEESMAALLIARLYYTDKPWPERPHPELNPAENAAWFAARRAEQIADGRA